MEPLWLFNKKQIIMATEQNNFIPTLAIIGRPNVGKSTFFNKLAGKRLAIVEDRPGVTRDWRDETITIDDRTWRVIDTAGLEDSKDKTSIENRMKDQTQQAIDQADVVLMMIDVRAGVTPDDEFFAKLVRKTDKPILLAANKCEGKIAHESVPEAYSLGLGDPIALSAEHGTGFGDFVDALESIADKHHFWSDDQEQTDDENEDEKSLKLAIVGRPNGGKSTLVNALLDEDRMMTGPEAGITRDSITIQWQYDGKPIRLVDTAGVRKKMKITDGLEKTMAQESFRAVRLAHIVAIVVDATLGLDKQDLALARRVVDEGRGLIIVLNKWDSVTNKETKRQETIWRLEDSLAQVKNIPLVTISALKKQRLNKLMDAVFEMDTLWNTRISTGKLNRWLDAMLDSHPVPLSKGRANKVKYITQIKSRPPTFSLWVGRPKEFPESYRRYLVNGLRESFNLPGVPLRLNLKGGKNPYVSDSNQQ
jgi:GTP-binding protein